MEVICTHMALPSPQSTNLITKFTAGIQPDAHSFFSINNLHPDPLLLLLFVKGLRISVSASVVWSSPSSSDASRKRVRRRGVVDVDSAMIMR